MTVDANLKCTTFQCQMALSYCCTKCACPGRNGKQCKDLAAFAASEPERTAAVVTAVGGGAHSQGFSSAFRAAFPELLPGGIPTQKPSAPPAVKPVEKATVRPSVSIADLPSAIDFTSKLPGAAEREMTEAIEDLPEKEESDVCQSPPTLERAIEIPGVTEKPAEKPVDKAKTIHMSEKPHQTQKLKDKQVTLNTSTSTSFTTAAGVAAATATHNPDNQDVVSVHDRRVSVAVKLPPITRRKKVLPNISGMNYFMETERGSNVFVLLPVNNSSDALAAHIEDPNRRLILATGVTYEFAVTNLAPDSSQ
jgi:hypothetical protein